MRWSALFADLEAQLQAGEEAELAAEVRDRTRREAALLSTADRLRAAQGSVLQVVLEGAGTLSGRLVDAGPDWLLLDDGPGREALAAGHAVLGVLGLGRRVAAPGSEGEVGRRLDLRWALRGLARDRAPLSAVLRDGSRLSGTLDRVGADHVEIAEHAVGEVRRATAVQGVRLVPLGALAVLRTG